MERTKFPNKSKLSTKHLEILGSVVGRMLTAANLGYQYGTERDVYKALGYETGEITFDKYLARYLRQDVAKAIIDRPVIATWRGEIELIETNEVEETQFEKAWRALDRKLGLKTTLSRIDRLTGIGRYGILLLGTTDVADPTQFVKPIAKKVQLVYVKPFSEQSAKIQKYETDPKNERYGLPLIYELQIQDVSTNSATTSSRTILVHYSRVLHIVDDNLESDIYGTPRLQAVFNRLMDLDKVVGGSGEMFWRGARPGYQGKIDPNYQMTTATKEDLKDQVDEFENNLRRILVNEGVDLEALAPQVADPSKHVQVILQMISAETGIPIRVLTGSERGELASSQDTGEWLSYVQARREEHAEPRILRVFVDKLIELGVLPTPTDGYTVRWSDLFALSEKERVEIGKARATALREYTYSPMEQGLIPPKAFFEKFLGFTWDEIELMENMRTELMSDEELYKKIEEAIDAENQTGNGANGTNLPAGPTE